MTQPARNAGPFTFARSENRIRMMAMIGIGLIAMPIANGRTSLMPWFMRRERRSVGAYDGRLAPRAPGRVDRCTTW